MHHLHVQIMLPFYIKYRDPRIVQFELQAGLSMTFESSPSIWPVTLNWTCKRTRGPFYQRSYDKNCRKSKSKYPRNNVISRFILSFDISLESSWQDDSNELWNDIIGSEFKILQGYLNFDLRQFLS